MIFKKLKNLMYKQNVNDYSLEYLFNKFLNDLFQSNKLQSANWAGKHMADLILT